MNSFYVELSSNARYQYNTVANFRNKIQLLHPLHGNWEVGMSEISYTKSWKNLSEDCDMRFEIMFDEPVKHKYEYKVEYAPFKNEGRKGIIRSGYYDSVPTLFKE